MIVRTAQPDPSTPPMLVGNSSGVLRATIGPSLVFAIVPRWIRQRSVAVWLTNCFSRS